MQKLESSLKNMVLVLVGVALIVGAVLAYINHLTSGPIAEKAAQSLAAGIKRAETAGSAERAETAGSARSGHPGWTARSHPTVPTASTG